MLPRRIGLFPEELVKEIIAHYLHVPFHDFSDTDGDDYYALSPFDSPHHISSSVVLLVCKQWLRIATPLLYSTTIIRSKLQSQALQRTLKSNPSVAQYIKQLRLEGPFGKVFKCITKKARKIQDICITFDGTTLSEDDATPLIEGLCRIKPKTAIINIPSSIHGCELKTDRRYKALKKLYRAINDCLRQWPHLTFVHITLSTPRYCTIDECGEREDVKGKGFALALSQREPNLPAVQVRLEFTCYLFLPEIIGILSDKPSVKSIDLRTIFPRNQLQSPFGADEPLYLPPIVRINGQSLDRVCQEEMLTPAACQLAEKLSDETWGHILAFAMDEISNRERLALVEVCKKFQKLGARYLYKNPVLDSAKSFVGFARQISKNSSLRLHVETVTFDSTRENFHRNQRYNIWTSLERDSMAGFFRSCPNLKVLESTDSDHTPLTWEAFEHICNTSAKQMTTFRPIAVDSPMSNELGLTSLLYSFRNIVCFRWHSPARFIKESIVSPDMFLSLEELEYDSSMDYSENPNMKPQTVSLMALLCRMSLPALRTLCLEGGCFEAKQFLIRHGSKLTTLEIRVGACHAAAIFDLCPSLRTFKVTGEVGYWQQEFVSIFECTSHRQPLERLIIAHHPRHHTRDKLRYYPTNEVQFWTRMLHPDRYIGFSTLREIECSFCVWPKVSNARDMKNNFWPRVSARLLDKGIELTDLYGRCWVPRMGDTTPKNLRR